MSSLTPSPPSLTIVSWGALHLADGVPVEEGCVGAPTDIPAGVRRRLGAFEKAVVQIVTGLAEPDEATHVTLGSRYGNLASTAAILDSLAQGEPPSPTQFSHSVLNAGCGVANQVRRDRTSHTAISAGRATLHGALTEAWLHMAETPTLAHIVVLADMPFPDVYAPLKPRWDAGLAFGMRVVAAPAPPAVASDYNGLGRDGYALCLDRLREGGARLALNGADWVMT